LSTQYMPRHKLMHSQNETASGCANFFAAGSQHTKNEMHLEITELSSCDEEIGIFLDTLSRTVPSVLGYHYPFYRDMLLEIGLGKPIYLGAHLNGKLIGLLPAFAFASEAGIVYSSLPFFGPNAGVLCDTDEKRTEIHSALLHALLTHAHRAGALSCSIYTPFLFDEFNLYDAVMPHAIIVNKFTQYLDIESVNWRHGTLGKALRKAERAGVTIVTEVTPERIETFYAIYGQNCAEFGIPQKPKNCVEFLSRPDMIGQHTDIYFAFHEGEMIGGLLILRSPLTISYYIPCSLPNVRILHPGDILIHRAMQDARGRGLRFWNWESSPSRDSGVYRFKKKWGAVESPYRIYVQPFQPSETFKELGKKRIAKHFPFYFVYPFERLPTEGT